MDARHFIRTYCKIKCGEHATPCLGCDIISIYCKAIQEEVPKHRERISMDDVKKIKYGRWTLNKDGSAICSECGRRQLNAWDMDGWDNFCHHCGVDMRWGGVNV